MTQIRREPLTPAQILFKDKKILTERPEGMSFEDYRILQAGQNRLLKRLFRKG